jgi:glutamate dehydrogenase
MFRLMTETGAEPAAAVRAYLLARAVFRLEAVWARIDALDNIVPDAVQTTMQVHLIRLMVRAAPWFLRHSNTTDALGSEIARFSHAVGAVVASLDSVIGEEDGRRVELLAGELVASGVPADLARQVASVDLWYAALDICDAAGAAARSIDCVARLYFMLSERLAVAWLRERIRLLPSHTQWQTLARAGLRDDLEEQLRSLTAAVLDRTPGAEEPAALLGVWEEAHRSELVRVLQVLADVQAAKSPDLAMLSVALRELRRLA